MAVDGNHGNGVIYIQIGAVGKRNDSIDFILPHQSEAIIFRNGTVIDLLLIFVRSGGGLLLHLLLAHTRFRWCPEKAVANLLSVIVLSGGNNDSVAGDGAASISVRFNIWHKQIPFPPQLKERREKFTKGD